MAICDFCHKEMLAGVACTFDFPPDECTPRIPHPADAKERCHDCFTPPGGLHHPGCDSEECSECHGQAALCGCV